ncbi:MAG: hypothetical protein WCH07_10315 [Deltaproteobacteria bacterium]
MHSEEGAKINCPTFQKQELIIKEITNKINATEGVTGKAVFAEELRIEADVLLACQDYKDANPDCKKCRFIAALRRKTADLIVKVKKLA